MSTNSDVTIFETTAEVKISDSGFSAQSGIGNIVYNQITKSGTDHFHGAGYEYFQNNALNAAPLCVWPEGQGAVPSLQQLRVQRWRPGLATKYFGRLDYDITKSNRLTISETESDNPATNLGIGICPIQCQSGDVGRNNAQITDVHTFSAHLLNEARFGFTDQLNFFVPYTLNQGYPSKIAWQYAKADNFPGVGINGFYGLGSQSNSVYKEFVFDPSDVVTLIRGKHILHFGGEFLISRADSTAWGNINAGGLSFNGRYTSINGQTSITPCKGCAAYVSGLGYADFLLGQSQSWGAGVTPEFGARQKSPQLFVQDDVKLRPNLTVNLGLRYEANTGWSEVKGNESTFDPTVLNPGTGILGAIWYGTTKANGRTQLVAPQWNIWLPRLGFSWAIAPNTVLRGAFGIYAAQLSEDTYGGGMGGEFGSRGGANDNTNGICPVVQFAGTGSTPDTVDPGCGVGAFNAVAVNPLYLNAPTTPDARNVGNQGPGYTQYHTPVPTNYQWTVSLQRQFGNSWGASLAYVGNHGKNLNFPVDINQVPESKLGPNDQGSKPYPIYGNIGGSTNNAISNYDALQTVMQKRLSHGLEFNVNYVWSHFLDDQDPSGWANREGWQNYQNAYVPSDNYSNSNFDIRNAFKGQAIYTLPFGRGQQFLNNNWALDEFLGGWRVSSTFVIQDGNPLSITTGNYNNSNNQSGGYTQFANVVGNWHKGGSVYSRLNQWYNTDALTIPTSYTYGNFRRNVITGPGLKYERLARKDVRSVP